MTIAIDSYFFQWVSYTIHHLNSVFKLILYLSLQKHSYVINNDVVYLVLTEKNFSKRLAFNYLEDIQNEFIKQYGQKINSANRPYNFIEFGRFIYRLKFKQQTNRTEN